MIEIIIPIITSIVAYIFGYQKNRRDIESSALLNLEKSVYIYQSIIKDLSEKIECLTEKINKLEVVIDELKLENKELKSK